MFGIIISGHGEFAKGFEKTLELVMGTQEKLEFVNFTEGKTPLALEAEFKDAMEKIGEDEVLFLTDISGGTPFSTAALMSSDKIKVISGCNMAMVVEAINLRDDQNLSESIEEIIESAIDGIELFKPIEVENNSDFDSDGI
jgi:PTS system N-acetylgalactosamine-specific IIA component